LRDVVETLVNGPSTITTSHIREGVVVRVENEFGVERYKHKSFTFGVLEGYLKDNAKYVDREEAA